MEQDPIQDESAAQLRDQVAVETPEEARRRLLEASNAKGCTDPNRSIYMANMCKELEEMNAVAEEEEAEARAQEEAAARAQEES